MLFGTGLLGIFHETVISPSSDPQLLLLFAAMCGLPAFIQRDERNDSERDR
jgi:hypothetical protein